MKKFATISKFLIIFLIIIGWIFSGFPQILNFSPKIQEAQANPGTQIKTVEFYVYQFAPDALTATAAINITSGNGIKNTAWPATCGDANDASVVINLPETGIVVRKAWVEWFTDLEGLANSTNEMRFCRSGGPAATTTSFTNVRSTDGTENMPTYLTQDITTQIASGSQTYFFNGRLTGSVRGTDSVKLFITYEYDDTSVTQLKTVKYFVGCKTTESVAGTTDSYTVNPQIPETTVSIVQSFIEYSIQAGGSDTTDGIIFAGFNGANPALATGVDDVNRASHEVRTLWNTSTTVNLNTNNTITLVNNNDPEFLKCADWTINYTYDDSVSTTQLRTVRYGMGQDVDTLNNAAQETLGARAINLPDLATPSTNVRSSWLHYHGEPEAAGTLTPQVNITGAAAPSTGSAYNFGFRTNGGMIHIVWDIKTFFNAEWANGDTLTASGQCSAASTCSVMFAEFYVTYAYATSQATGIKTVEFFTTQDLVQNTAGTAHTDTFGTFIPETSTTFRNGATIYTCMGGAATVNMVLTATIDSAVAGTDTVSTTGLINAEEHDHRILLVHPITTGQLTNASQTGISVSLNHTNGTHLSGAITFSTYEYPLPAVVTLTFTIDTGSVSFVSAITPGTPVSTSTVLTVNTNSSTGYNISVIRASTTPTLFLTTNTIPDTPNGNNWTAPVATSTAGPSAVWTAGTTKGLGFRVKQTGTVTNTYSSTWWGTNDTAANALYSGIATSTATAAQSMITKTTLGSATNENTTVEYKLDVITTQKSGAYISSPITYTAVVN
ncbi:MAG: hypothetical protein AAB456_00690 [Patescibacteria group bacterium]